MAGRTPNKVRNPDFRLGASSPRHWRIETSSRRAGCRRDDQGGVELQTGPARASVFLTQTLPCRPGQHYRIELTAACDLRADDDAAGLVLQVAEGGRTRRRSHDGVCTPGVHRAAEPVTVRTYYKTSGEVRSLTLRVGIRDARGRARLLDVRMMAILEPEHASHILAIPPPPVTLAPPLTARRIVMVTAAADRPLAALLRAAPGVQRVTTLSPRDAAVAAAITDADAVILPDDELPPRPGTLAALCKLAKARIVIVSTSAFAQAAGASASVRRVEQDDDPIHAAVAYGGWPTRGFALRDALPFAWPGRAPGSLAQRHFRRTVEFKTLCERHGLVALLTSLCDKDVTSQRPVALYGPTPGGALFVMDVQPAEAPSSTFAEPVTALHLLLGLLGHAQAGLGQYVVPDGAAVAFRAALRETAERFGAFTVHDDDVPTGELTHQLVTVGILPSNPGTGVGGEGSICSSSPPCRGVGERSRVRHAASSALGAGESPAPQLLQWGPRPTILVRTGLRSGDVESVYAAFVWFKQLARMAPHVCPYAQALASRFRLAWIPLAAEWKGGYGWRRQGAAPRLPFELEAESGELAALIDIVARPVNRICAVVPELVREYECAVTWLAELAQSFGPPPTLTWDVDAGEPFTDRTEFDWRVRKHRVHLRADSDMSADPVVRRAVAAGAQVFRLELPARDADFVAHSIHLTDAAATTLEHLVGLQYGLIAVNRRPAAVQFNGFPPVEPGQALVIPRDDPALKVGNVMAG